MAYKFPVERFVKAIQQKLKEEKLPDAINQVKRALRSYPKEPQLLLLHAELLLAGHNLFAAKKAVHLCQKLLPAHAKTWLLSARLARHEKEVTNAKRYLRKAETIGGSTAELQLERLQLLCESGTEEAALRLVDEQLERSGQLSGSLLRFAASCAAALEDHTRQQNYLRRAVQLNHRDSESLTDLRKLNPARTQRSSGFALLITTVNPLTRESFCYAADVLADSLESAINFLRELESHENLIRLLHYENIPLPGFKEQGVVVIYKAENGDSEKIELQLPAVT